MHKISKEQNRLYFCKSYCIDRVKYIIVRRLPGTYNNKTRLSGHRYLNLLLTLTKLDRGVGYWKMNVSHLENENYKQGVVDIYNDINSTLPF